MVCGECGKVVGAGPDECLVFVSVVVIACKARNG